MIEAVTPDDLGKLLELTRRHESSGEGATIKAVTTLIHEVIERLPKPRAYVVPALPDLGGGATEADWNWYFYDQLTALLALNGRSVIDPVSLQALWAYCPSTILGSMHPLFPSLLKDDGIQEVYLPKKDLKRKAVHQLVWAAEMEGVEVYLWHP